MDFENFRFNDSQIDTLAEIWKELLNDEAVNRLADCFDENALINFILKIAKENVIKKKGNA